MNLPAMVSRPSRLHPLSLFVQLTSQLASGRLHITNGTTSWFIYLVQGKLSFASNSVNPFERLDRHLNQLSRHIPTLVGAIRSEVRSRFETLQEPSSLVTADYAAICWLVEQEFLDSSQVTGLIAELAKEVIESLLKVTEGFYEFSDRTQMVGFPDLSQLELRPIVEHCQNKLRQQSINRASFAPPPPSSPAAERGDETRVKVGGFQNLTQNSAPNASPILARGRYTIACIDDSPTVLQAINSFLDDSNCSVVMINDPLKALMQIIRCKPDLILLDVGMPNLDGYELCSLLRKHSNFKNIPIVMVTGNTGFIDRAKAKLVGASGYMTKPFTRPDLLKMVFKHLT